MLMPPENHSKTMKGLREAIPLAECLAKTYATSQGVFPGRTVFNHCQIVGEVARELLSRMPQWLRDHLYPEGSELAAAGHDIGKVSPTFLKKLLLAIDKCLADARIELAGVDPTIERMWGGHAGASQATALWVKSGKYIPEILGQHHGYSPQLGTRMATDDCFGGAAWQSRREELIQALKEVLDCEWPKVKNEYQARAISGLTSVADWIGSGPFFENPQAEWRPSITTALDNAGFVAPRFVHDLSFQEIFGFDMLDAQQKLGEAVREPGVYVLEAPMGLGKTEAALYAAYRMLSQGRATGLYFALPTQLTSDKIHDRVNQFLQRVLHADCRHRQALLLHGNAWLKSLEMGEEGQPGGSWFNSAKRGILAPFAVGTIDQTLMAVMNVKHGFVRTFGLAGKVVILDEVHSYDCYTGTLLDELVKLLRHLQCTVIILSATLNRERRQDLLGLPVNRSDYPLVTALPNGANALTELNMAPMPDKPVELRLLQAEQEALEEALRRAEQGQQVLWIENTVGEAQRRYLLLAGRSAAMGIPCGLLHSRFAQCDRVRHEAHWVSLFGKAGHVARENGGRILVGTQVLEQSLDIDADFLISRFCPTDMLLQRLGRLWRHERTPRPVGTRHEAWLLAPTIEQAADDPAKAFGDSAWVYQPYVLLRSLAVWQAKTTVQLPGDIRPLVDATYEAREEQGVMARLLHELENGGPRRKGREQLKRMAWIGLSKGGKTLSEDKAGTRYSDMDSVQLLLLTQARRQGDSTTVCLLDGSRLELPCNGRKLSKPKWRELAAELTRHCLQVAEHIAPNAVPANSLFWLKDYFYLGNPQDGESLLRVALVAPDGGLKALDGGPVNEEYALSYDDRLGYRAVKANPKTKE